MEPPQEKDELEQQYAQFSYSWASSTTSMIVYASMVTSDLLVAKAYHNLVNYAICTTLRHFIERKLSRHVSNV